MRAILVKEPFKIEITEIPKPTITKPDEVLVKVISGGICGSDMHIYTGSNPLSVYPCIIGHEFGGEVVETGSGVTHVKPGDKVAVDPVVSCGKCYACTHDRHNVCRELEVRGVHRDGGFAEYALVTADVVHPVTGLADDLMCMVEPYSIGMQINCRANIERGDKVLVMGSGPIGITAMQIAKARGAQVMMTDLLDSRLDRAKEMGADEVVNVSNEDLTKRVMDFTDGEGMPVIVDSVCSLESPVTAIELASPAGRVVILGFQDKPSQIPQILITKKELTIVGSRLSNHRFPKVIEGFENGSLTPEKMVSHSFHFTQVAEAIKLITEHPEQVCKVRLLFS